MKNLRFHMFAVLLLLGAACNNKKHYTTEELLQKGQGPNMNAGTGKFSIGTPIAWQRMDTVLSGIHVTFLLGPSRNNEFRPNFNIVSESMQGLSLDSYFDKSIEPMSKYLENFSAGPKGEKDIDGIHAKWQQYSHHQNGYDIDVLVYFIPKDGIAYLITCSVPKGQLEQYQAKFDEALRSFHVS
jgi:hypothetical protein